MNQVEEVFHTAACFHTFFWHCRSRRQANVGLTLNNGCPFCKASVDIQRWPNVSARWDNVSQC